MSTTIHESLRRFFAGVAAQKRAKNGDLLALSQLAAPNELWVSHSGLHIDLKMLPCSFQGRLTSLVAQLLKGFLSIMIHKWLLSSGHFQTIWGPVWRRLPHLDRKRYRLLTSDRDFIHIDVQESSCAADVPLRDDVGVIIWHGLTGSSNSHYVLGLQECLTVRNILSVAVNHRGCSGETNWLARSYHAGDAQDIDFLVRKMDETYPGRRWVLCAYSLGASMMINWLSQSDVPPSVVGAIAVSVPFELAKCSDYVNSGVSRIYRNRLLRTLQNQIAQKKETLRRVAPEEYTRLDNMGDVDRFQDFKCFDDEFVAPLHGFQSGSEYYETCSVRPQLTAVDLPLVLIHSKDDPLMPSDAIPSLDELHHNTLFHCQEDGGHLGFLRPSGLGVNYWLDETVARLVEAMAEEAALPIVEVGRDVINGHSTA